MKKQKVTSQMKGQDKIWKTTKWSGNRQPSRKRIQNNDREDDLGSQKKNGDDARNICQRPRRTKKQTYGDEQYTRRNQWQNKAEDWKGNLEERMVEITAARQNMEKRMKKKNEDNLRDLWDMPTFALQGS